MADEREVYPSFKILPCTARAILATIDREIGQGTSAAISKGGFAARGFGNGMLRPSLARLEKLGHITIERGSINPRVPNIYRLSNRWRELSEAEARQLVIVPRKRKPRQVRAMKRVAALQQQAEAEQPGRRHFGDDSLVRRLREGERAR
jgi:hypothetical protein